LAQQQTIAFRGTVIGSAGTTGQILFASSGSGYFKSTNAGQSWTPMYITEPGLAQPPFSSLVADRRNETTLYLATTLTRGGVWRTTDGGATWTLANGGLPQTGDAVQSLTMTRERPETLYLRTGSAIYKTENAGETWTRQGSLLPTAGGHFDVNPTNPSRMYFARMSQVWRSDDEGVTWNATSTMQTFGETVTGAACIASDPLFPNLLYVCVAGPLIRVGNVNVTGVHRSVDGGLSMQPPLPLPALANQPISMWVDPNGGQNVITGQSSGGYCKSRDQGANWRCPGSTVLAPDVTPTGERFNYLDQRNSNLAYASASRFGTGGGPTFSIFRSRDAGETWTAMPGTVAPTLNKLQPIHIVLVSGGTASTQLTISSIDQTAAAMPFTATTSGASWLRLSAAAGTTPATLTATLQLGEMEPGVYEATITIRAPLANQPEVTVPVRLTVPKPVSSTGPVYERTKIAGNGNATFSGDGAAAVDAGIGPVSAISVDATGQNVYFATADLHRIRRISAASGGTISTVAGIGAMGSSPDGTPAAQALVNRPNAIAVDPQGTVHFVDASRAVRRVAGGTVATSVAPAVTAPEALTTDQSGRLWILSLSRFTRYIPPSGTQQFMPVGKTFSLVSDIAFDAFGNLMVAETLTHQVWKVTPAGVVTAIAGTGAAGTGIDGVPATASPLNRPTRVAVDARGNVFITESAASRIRIVTPAGLIFTIYRPAAGDAVPGDLATDRDGNVYFAAGNYIHKLTPVRNTNPEITLGPRNLASGTDRLSPGTLFYIEGDNLASSEESLTDPPWAETLGGASVRINGALVPLNAAAPNRLSGQIPWDAALGDASISVTVSGIESEPKSFTLTEASPGIFASAEDGSALNASISDDGEVTIFAAGIGPVDPPIAAGTAPGPDDPPPAATLPFSVTVGDLEGEPIDSVLMPGTPGIARIRFRLPANLEPGTYPVTLKIGNAISNTVLLSR
jgi:uncharacterized protein (TIGR03437 family)